MRRFHFRNFPSPGISPAQPADLTVSSVWSDSAKIVQVSGNVQSQSEVGQAARQQVELHGAYTANPETTILLNLGGPQTTGIKNPSVICLYVTLVRAGLVQGDGQSWILQPESIEHVDGPVHALIASFEEDIGDHATDAAFSEDNDEAEDISVALTNSQADAMLIEQPGGTELVRYPHAATKKANELVLYVECEQYKPKTLR